MTTSKPVAASKGLFIVLEGIDGAGTTTQGRRLVRRLRRRGLRATFTSEPSTGVVGRYIRRCLRARPGPSPERLALLFAADRLDHLERVIRPALRGGAVVVCDRYVLSSLAYQGVEGDAAWVRTLNARAPAPDLTVLLDVSPRVAARRRGSRGTSPDRYEVDAFQREVAARYRRLTHARGVGRVACLDGHAEPARIALEIDALLARLLPRRP